MSGHVPEHAPAHRLRNAVILGAFIAVVISDALSLAGLLPMSGVALLLVTLAGYGLLVGVAVTVRFAVTGKNVHQP